MTQIAIDWSTAEADEGTVTVSLAPAPSSAWRKRFRAVAAQLDHAEPRWGAVAAKKDRITVDAVTEGAEADIRHYLESIILQANAGEGDEHGGDDQAEGPDARMTETFRAFAEPDAASAS